MTDFIGPEFIPGDGCAKDKVSTVGTPDNRVWGLFDNRISFVPMALNHCFRWSTPECRKAIPSGNSGAIKSDMPPALGFIAVLFFEIPFG